MSVMKLKYTSNSLLGQWLLFVFPFQTISLPGVFSGKKYTVFSQNECLQNVTRIFSEKVP